MKQLQGNRSHNHSPIAILFERYAQIILNYIQRYVSSREDADDLVTEVFLAALENQVWISWSEGEQLAWLRRIAYHKAVDYLRRVSRRPFVPLDDALDMLFENDEDAPEQVALRNEDYAQLRTHLARLPALQQEILRLRFARGLRSKEIAQILNKSDSVIRVLLSRAVNLLRDIYK